ncbi:AFG1-like ATPase [Polychaeton citri CBS 116435]|uniref:AFG1-like ATPase n=1 Tax=Polychaeton citri CBS 116435 TaxID=1314669 RepID=A0A9P4QEY2_9PEZI|nr:AFG1-like ATPase [Polychaeton citri CBS 116435]
MSATLLEAAYQSLLARGRLSAHPGQASLVHRLTKLQRDLGVSGDGEDRLQGLYVFGGVGTGKSRIVDLFSATLAPSVTRRRAHFHEFMLDIHSRLHRARSASGYADDPLPQIGRDVRRESRVLCFDEFQVTDIADAMILQRLFRSIWGDGGVLVSTSNRHPDMLYENGLNRALFVPFIAQLKKQCELWKMDVEQNYRMIGGSRWRQTIFTDIGAYEAAIGVAQAGQPVQTVTIPVMMGRKLEVQATGKGSSQHKLEVFATFEELCQKSLGAADYHALCHLSKTIFLKGLRHFRTNELDFARRFITLIDLAYESSTKIVVYAEESLETVFDTIVAAEQQRANRLEGNTHDSLGQHQSMTVKRGGGSSSSMMSTFVGNDTEWSATGLRGAHLAAGGAGETDVVFAISRAMSRLHEMGSDSYGLKD